MGRNVGSWNRNCYHVDKAERWWIWINGDEEYSSEDLQSPLLTLPDDPPRMPISVVSEWAASELEDELHDASDYGECELLIWDRTDDTWYRVSLAAGGWSFYAEEVVDRASLLGVAS